MSEANLKKSYLDKLRSSFEIFEEVSGEHFSGKTFRIDAIVQPKDTTQWKNPNVALGIEFKDTIRFAQNYDTKDYTKWLSQCIDYGQTYWDNFGYVYVFACPGLIGGVAKSMIQDQKFIRHFMGQLGVGELMNVDYKGLTFLVNDTHRIWSEREGVKVGKQWLMTRKFGSK